MKILIIEIFRVYKKAPIKITIIWFLDLVEALILISNPYIIGNCIDGLLKKDIFWFIALVVIDITFWLSRTANKFFDTRIYSKIVGHESYDYYIKMINENEDNSLIDARLDMVDDIPNFLEIDFFPHIVYPDYSFTPLLFPVPLPSRSTPFLSLIRKKPHF